MTTVLIYNSLEEFKYADKKELLSLAGQELWEVIKSSKAAENPSKLNTALLLLFPDLKGHEYTYWYVIHPKFTQFN